MFAGSPVLLTERSPSPLEREQKRDSAISSKNNIVTQRAKIVQQRSNREILCAKLSKCTFFYTLHNYCTAYCTIIPCASSAVRTYITVCYCSLVHFIDFFSLCPFSILVFSFAEPSIASHAILDVDLYYSDRRKPRTQLRREHLAEMDNLLSKNESQTFLYKKFINDNVGLAVFTSQFIKEGRYLAEYPGKRSTGAEGRVREKELADAGFINRCYAFFYMAMNPVSGKTNEYCLDAEEIAGSGCDDLSIDKFSILFNHDKTHPSAKPIVVYDLKGDHHLVFLARRDLPPGTMVTYDYNDRRRLYSYRWLMDNVSITDLYIDCPNTQSEYVHIQ